jgi:hypothetical protein
MSALENLRIVRLERGAGKSEGKRDVLRELATPFVVSGPFLPSLPPGRFRSAGSIRLSVGFIGHAGRNTASK